MNKLSLDGRFWGPWIKETFVEQVNGVRRLILELILPQLPDPNVEGTTAARAAWEDVMSTLGIEDDDPAGYVDWATERGINAANTIVSLRQAVLNMGCVMLWHVFEQQLLFFHARQVLSIQEEQAARQDKDDRRRLFSLNVLHERMEGWGRSIKSLPSWPPLSELNLVANVVKHGPGISLDKLAGLRPDLLIESGEDIFSEPPDWIELAAYGEDVYVKTSDFENYCVAAAKLWEEFATLIQKDAKSTD